MTSSSNPSDGGDGLEKIFDSFVGTIRDIFKPAADTPDALKFFSAVKGNRVAEVERLLDAGFDPKVYNSHGQTALHVAAMSGSAEAALLLINRGLDPRMGTKDEPERTPLVEAISFGKLRMVEVLVQHGGYTPGEKFDGWTLLHHACRKGRAEVVDILLQVGADSNERTGNGSTPLMVAINFGHGEVVKVLLKFAAAAAGISQHFAHTDARRRTAFHMAVDARDEEMVVPMITMGANINGRDAEERPPLLWAIEKGDADMVRLLVQSGADLNVVFGAHGTPLVYACTCRMMDERSRAEIVETLIRSGADPDIPCAVTGRTPVHAALASGYGDYLLDTLLRYPLQLNTRDKHGNTPLAVARGMHVGALLEAGADPNFRHGDDAATPLINAVHRGDKEAVMCLATAGADPRLCDADGKSALSYARARRDGVMISTLERMLKAKSGFKNTPK